MKRFLLKHRLLTAVVAVCLFLAAGLVVVPMPSHRTASAATATPGVATPGVSVIVLSFFMNTPTNTVLAKFKLPYKAQVLGVSAHTGYADLSSGDETYLMKVEGSTLGHIVTPFILNTPAAVQEGTVVNATVPDEETITLTINTGGTSPNIANITVSIPIARM